MSAQSEEPLDEAERQKVMREQYVYRDMVEGFLMDDVTVERLGTASNALTQTRGQMIEHGIEVLLNRRTTRHGCPSTGVGGSAISVCM